MIIALAVVAAAVGAALVVWMIRRRRRSTPPRPGAAGVRTLSAGLAPTRRALGARLSGLLSHRLDPGGSAELEEVLLGADVGVAATVEIIEALARERPADGDEARRALRRLLAASFRGGSRDLHLAGVPAVIVVVGVNGSGKTTTAAKLGALLDANGTGVLLGAADTFRAAAGEQLRTWAEKLGLDAVVGQSGADPASVAFDAYRAAVARSRKAVIIDTAGRMHSKKNLMDELSKIVRVLRREAGEVGEVLLVLDGTAGQNGIAQARAFTEAVGVTGLVVTKLDGTARGGIAVAVERDLGIPVKYVGVGEGAFDLLPFEVGPFVDAIMGAA